HGEAEHGRAAWEVGFLDVELVVVVHAWRLAAIRVAFRAHRRVLVDGYRIRLPLRVQGPERAVDVDARDDDPAADVRQRVERAFSVGPCQGAAVDDRVRAKGRQLAAVLDELRAIAVKVLGLRHVVWLELAAMHEQQLVARGRELLDRSAANEPRAAQNNDFQTTAFRPCSWRRLARPCRWSGRAPPAGCAPR